MISYYNKGFLAKIVLMLEIFWCSVCQYDWLITFEVPTCWLLSYEVIYIFAAGFFRRLVFSLTNMTFILMLVSMFPNILNVNHLTSWTCLDLLLGTSLTSLASRIFFFKGL